MIEKISYWKKCKLKFITNQNVQKKKIFSEKKTAINKKKYEIRGENAKNKKGVKILIDINSWTKKDGGKSWTTAI